MPSTYAHLTLGNATLEAIKNSKSESSTEIFKLIEKHKQLFWIGLDGPDIFFYYKALKKNPIKERAYAIHREQSSVFLGTAATKIQSAADKDAALAYLLGFCCHFSLDSEAHSYVEHFLTTRKITHSEIETSLDTYLMAKNNINSRKYNATSHLDYGEKEFTPIAHIYGYQPSDVETTLKSAHFYNQMFMPSLFKNIAAPLVMKAAGLYEDMHGLLIVNKHSPHCQESNVELEKILYNTVPIALDLVENFHQHITLGTKLSPRFDRTFGPYEPYMEHLLKIDK